MFSVVVFNLKASRATVFDATAASVSTVSLPGHTATIRASENAFGGHSAMLCSQCYVVCECGLAAAVSVGYLPLTYRGCGDPTQSSVPTDHWGPAKHEKSVPALDSMLPTHCQT